MSINLTPSEVRAFYQEVVPDLPLQGREWRGACPVHQGAGANFAVNPETGDSFCHSKCQRGWDIPGLYQALNGGLEFPVVIRNLEEIVGRKLSLSNGNGHRTPRAGLRIEAPYPYSAVYCYVDENGAPLYEVLREDKDDAKSFRQRRPDGKNGWVWNLDGVRRVLYRLPAVLAADVVFVVEGEKCAEALNKLLNGSSLKRAVAATTAPGGAGKWQLDYAHLLQGKTVIVLPDNDEPGRRHAIAVVQSLVGVAKAVRVVELPDLPPKGDVVDFIDAGGSFEELRKLYQQSALVTDVAELRARWNISDDVSRRVRNLTVVEGDDEWPDPLPISGTLEPVLPFDKMLLPDSLRPLPVDISERMNVPIDFPAAAMITTLAGATNRRVLIQPKEHDTTWTQPLNLWGGIVGVPGSKKTPVIDEITKPLKNMQNELHKAHESNFENYSEEQAAYEAELVLWKNEVKTAAKNGRPRPTRPAPPIPPTETRLYFTDATFEALHKGMVENPDGVFVLRDELAGWFAQLERQGREQERAFCLEAANGTSPFVIDRVGRGTVFVEYACMSLFGGIQPSKLAEYLQPAISGGLGDDGLMQRMQVLVYPDEVQAYTRVDRLADDNAYKAWERILDTIRQLPSGSPRVFRFSKDAQGCFYHWFDENERRRIRKEFDNAAMSSHFAKYPKFIAILSALFHLADQIIYSGSIVSCEVPVKHVERAVGLARYFESHAKRVYGFSSNPATRAAANLAEKIKLGKLLPSFNQRDIYHKSWTGLRDRSEVDPALRILEERDWLRQLPNETPSGTPGRPRLSQYVVNPKVFNES